MVAITDQQTRIAESSNKMLPPFEVDPALCLYSPQDNVDSLANLRVRAWHDFVLQRYEPPPTDARRVLLFLPCTRTKPYIASLEHQRINERLLAEGFEPVGGVEPLPDETLAALQPTDLRLFDPSPLRRGDVELTRVVMSEPLAFVPYEHSISFNGHPSPSACYDDPGLFEHRGNAVAPWRDDCTATELSPTKWRWGRNEKQAYAEMHNTMADIVARVLQRLSGSYAHRISWVAPGLTHRSFCLARDQRREHRVVASKRAGAEIFELIGANDYFEVANRIDVLPTAPDCDHARERLRHRLGTSPQAANALFARGGGGATPLAVPELLDVLIARLDELG